MKKLALVVVFFIVIIAGYARFAYNYVHRAPVQDPVPAHVEAVVPIPSIPQPCVELPKKRNTELIILGSVHEGSQISWRIMGKKDYVCLSVDGIATNGCLRVKKEIN